LVGQTGQLFDSAVELPGNDRLVPKTKNQAFDLTEAQLKQANFASVEDYDGLASWLKNELEDALSARGDIAADIRYRWLYYEQGRTRRSTPWPDAADLTSPYATEFVDAILARLMDTICVEPLWIVEGWGDSTARAPFVEEFHQRAQEQERLQGYLREVLLRALIEPAGILEVSDAVDMQRQRKTIKAALQLDPVSGAPVLGEDAEPMLQQDEQGNYVESDDPNTPQAETVIDSYEPVRLGPSYDVIPYLDYVRFPQHARSKSEIWGYGKRFWRRVPELQAKVKQGMYDGEAVEQLGESDERIGGSQHGVEPSPTSNVTQQGPTAQKELWEIPFNADLDGEGARWYLATISREHTKLLRLKVDDRSTRFLEFVPFPKPGSRDGYSLVEKMITLLEEDTAVRNMRADRAALALGGTILDANSGWDPYEQPVGPGRVITGLRDLNSIRELQFSDVPQSINVWKNDIRSDLERGVGLNDVSVGTQTEERRTLGEVRLAAGYSEVRVKSIITSIQESLEELGQARHAIWIKTLQERPQGLPLPSSLMNGLDARGINTASIADGRVTAQMLEGQFWFKPRGSVETANLDQQAQWMFGLLKALAPLIQLCPPLGAIFQTPQAAKALMEQLLRVMHWPDKQAFLGSEAQQALQGVFQQQQTMQDPKMQLLMAMAQHGGAGAGMPANGPAGQPPQAGSPPPPQGGMVQ
jgi:hypothetical protein